MDIKELLSNTNYIIVNKTLAKRFGLEESIMIGELVSEYLHWRKTNKLTEDGYFYSTAENVEENTTLTAHKQRKALNKLKELGLIDVQIRGLPAKRYIKLNDDAIADIVNSKMLKNYTTSCETF